MVESEKGWQLIQSTLMLGASYAEEVRRKYSPPKKGIADPKDIELISPKLEVKHGPFQGMKYPESSSFGSTLLPKLLGSYEKELHPLIEEICQTEYSQIIDIGCAEGYYAVGLALRIPTAKIFAYDIEPYAQELCKNMALKNGVGNRVEIGDFFTEETIRNFSFNGKSLVFCDCEGYEKELFNQDSIPFLTSCDLLIELHDCYDITISSYIAALFKETHEQIYVESIDDIKKARTYNYSEIAELDLERKKNILAENRLSIMEWVFLKAKQPQL